MKKNIVRIISLLVVLTLSFSLLAACGNGGGGSSGERVFSGEVLNEGAGDGSYSGVEITLKSDGSIEWKNYSLLDKNKEYIESWSFSGTWTENNDGTVTITFDTSAADGYEWEYDTGTFGIVTMKTSLPETTLTATKKDGKLATDLTVRTDGGGITTDMVYPLTEQ